MNAQHETRSWDTGLELPFLDTYVSLNDAFVIRYISEGSIHNQCHVTAVGLGLALLTLS